MHHLNFVAILEPRISGQRSEDVCRRIGLQGCVRVEASGFSGGIWCLWNPARINISVVATTTDCVHLAINHNTPTEWFFTVVYASLQVHLRPRLWEELVSFSTSNSKPWCLAGDFNAILQEHEKEGGAPFNYQSSHQFTTCIEACHLLDLGFKGPPFTWIRGSLRQRLDRVLCNTAWQALFPTSQVIYLPIPTSDHCALWLQDQRAQAHGHGRDYFKFLGPWIDHPGFKAQVHMAWQYSSTWVENMMSLTSNLKAWNRNVFGNIFRRKQRLLGRLEGINRVLLEYDNKRLEDLRDQLWSEYTTVVQQEEAYWY